MGKTKTAFVGGVTEEKISGSDKYAEKMRKKALQDATEERRNPPSYKTSNFAEATLGKSEGQSEKTEQLKNEEIKEQTTDYRLPATEKQDKEKEIKINVKNKAHKKSEAEKVHISGLKGGQRIKVIGEELPEQTTDDSLRTTVEKTEEKASEPKKQRKIKVRGNKYKVARAKVNKEKLYPISESIKLVRETNITKFDPTVELHISTKKVGLTVSVTLPHSFGKSKKIEVCSEETLKKLATGKINFDLLLATPEMMPKLVAFARLLGPKGLMPNPKNGTIIKSEADAKKFSADSITLKTQKDASVIHTSVGKLSQKDSELEENIKAVITAIDPKMVVRVFLKSTMSPSVKVKV